MKFPLAKLRRGPASAVEQPLASLPPLDTLKPELPDPWKYARVTCGVTDSANIHLHFETREFLADADGATAMKFPWVRGTVDDRSWKDHPQGWNFVRNAIFGENDVAELNAAKFDWEQDALAHGRKQAEAECGWKSTRILTAYYNEKLRRETEGELHGTNGKDYDLIYLRISREDKATYGTPIWVCVARHRIFDNGHSYSSSLSLNGETLAQEFKHGDRSWDNLVQQLETFYPLAKALLIREDGEWFEKTTAEAAEQRELAHRRELAQSTVAAVASTLHA